MKPRRDNYTVIRLSGKPEFFQDCEYFTVLSSIAAEYSSAGSNWDRPNMLLLCGKVVIQSHLADIAWSYAETNRKLHEDVRKQLREKFTPDWLAALEEDDGQK